VFKISDPKVYGSIGALIIFVGALVGLWVNPQVGKLLQDEAPKLFVLAPTGETVDGNPVVVATPVTSDTAVVAPAN
jgi:hypothetical protein